jgi:hypothetical protein
MKNAITGAIGLYLGLMTPGFAQASPVIPRDSVAFGRTYSDWAAAWWQWALSISATAHPLFDTADCGTGQTGPVFFLGGKVCASNAPSCTPGSATRSCTVDTSKGFKALFFPVVNTEDSGLEESRPSSQTPACIPEQPNPTINCMRKAAQDSIDPTTNLSVAIDGQTIPNLKSDFRVTSPAFDFTLPSHDNLFNAVGEGPFNGGTYSLAVDDGVYVMIAPLSKGTHTLHFKGTFPQFKPPFAIDITYNLTVK